jgi:hypothetical protein
MRCSNLEYIYIYIYILRYRNIGALNEFKASLRPITYGTFEMGVWLINRRDSSETLSNICSFLFN